MITTKSMIIWRGKAFPLASSLAQLIFDIIAFRASLEAHPHQRMGGTMCSVALRTCPPPRNAPQYGSKSNLNIGKNILFFIKYCFSNCKPYLSQYVVILLEIFCFNYLPMRLTSNSNSPFSKFVRRGVSTKETRRDEAGLMYRYFPSWGVGGDLAPSELSTLFA